MKLAKPRWNLAIYIVPPIFSSLLLVIFFPAYLFQFLIALSIFSTVLSGWVGIKNLPMDSNNINKLQDGCKVKTKGVYRWLLSLFGLIFLLGISSVFFIFLTAASQLSPDKLIFGDIVRIWHITFPVGICLLIAQIILAFLSQNNALKKKKRTKIYHLLCGKNAEAVEKTRISGQFFLKMSEFIALVISFSVVILTIANGLARWLGIEVPSGFQLQTMIGSTLIYLPFITQRWRKRRFLKSKHSRVYRLCRLAIELIIVIVLLSVLTLPFSGVPISVQFLSYGLTTFQWELFILAWWIGITTLIASQIIQLSYKRSWLHILIALIISSGVVYGMCAEFLAHGGEDYFLAVIREGILALILTALPIGGLILNVLPFQTIAEINLASLKHRQQLRNQEYLTHSLVQATALACALYWVSGLSILFVLLLIVAIPWVMKFLFVEMVRCNGV